MQTYIVQKGDTLYGISRQFGVSVNDIKLQNNLINDTIAVGSSLIIPTAGSTVLYTVKRGDTLYSIANKYNVTIANIMRVNNLTSTSLSIGQQLKIPITNTDTDEQFQYYTVVRGDTLYGIAIRFQTTVDTIKKLNNLTSNTLSIGQQLKVPRSASGGLEDYIFYVVKAGDTLYNVASKFGMTVDEVKALNNLSSNNLSIGQTLRVIQGNNSGIVSGASCYGEGYSEVQYVTYTVRPGDNLYNIAKAYNTSVDNIKLLNNLTTNNLSIGQVLKIKEVS